MGPLLLLATMYLVCASTFAQSNAPSTDAHPARAHSDQHEGMSVSADPYSDAERSKEKFGKADPLPAGILPVEVVLRNETDQPIRIDMSTIQLVVRPHDGARQDIDRLTTVEVAAAIAHPEGPAPPKAPRFPVGIPRSGTDKKVEKLADFLRPLSLDADVVPPMGAIHGFLFFNLSHNMSLAGTASLYLPDATVIPSKKALMFFEVSLGNAPQH
jgi:hypothetical protein